MILELIFFSALIFLIAVLFYKQRAPDLQILQLEHDQISAQLADLLDEQQPVVIRGTLPPRGLTAEALAKAPRLASFPVGGQTLSAVIAQPAILSSAAGMPTLSLDLRRSLAEELSIPVWATRNWLPYFAQCSLVGPLLGTMRAEAVLGGLGMWKTSAKVTAFAPTEGTYVVSILSVDSEQYLPKSWQYRYVSSLTPNDTPLVTDIKFLDIVVRPGTVLLIPPHAVVSMEPKAPTTFSAAAILEYHEPISLLAKSFLDN
jgi:hypothetical protein